MSDRAVLLVEDQPNEVELTFRAFRRQGLSEELDRIVVARDGEEALDYLFARGEHSGRDPGDLPEFVLLDVNLPKLTGPEVLERIRADERTKLVPVIMYSTSDGDPYVRAAYEAGANSYVTKPSNLDRFSEAMRSLGWYWLEWNEPPPTTP